MSRRKKTAEPQTLPDHAYNYARTAWVRIQADEISSGRAANMELELAMAYMRGFTDSVKHIVKEPPS